jgi:hypothetical protein
MIMRSLTVVLACIGACAGPVTGQSSVPLAPGDFIRFEFTQRVESRDATGRVLGAETVQVRREGTVVELTRDTLVIEDGGNRVRFATERVGVVRVLRSLENPRSHGFRRGAIGGGVFLGLAGTAFALCNPGLFGDGGCTGPEGAGMVVEFGLVGAAVGALTGGLFGALFASHSEWDTVRLAASASASGAVGFALRVPIGG